MKQLQQGLWHNLRFVIGGSFAEFQGSVRSGLKDIVSVEIIDSIVSENEEVDRDEDKQSDFVFKLWTQWNCHRLKQMMEAEPNDDPRKCFFRHFKHPHELEALLGTFNSRNEAFEELQKKLQTQKDEKNKEKTNITF